MNDTKVFRLDDQDLNVSNPIVTVPVVNAGFSRSMGAGFAVVTVGRSQDLLPLIDRDLLYQLVWKQLSSALPDCMV